MDVRNWLILIKYYDRSTCHTSLTDMSVVFIFCSRPRTVGALCFDGHRLSVLASICSGPDPKSRTEWRRNLKSGWKEAHETGDPWPHLAVEGQGYGRPINAVIENQPYLRNGKAYEF